MGFAICYVVLQPVITSLKFALLFSVSLKYERMYIRLYFSAERESSTQRCVNTSENNNPTYPPMRRGSSLRSQHKLRTCSILLTRFIVHLLIVCYIIVHFWNFSLLFSI